MKNSGHRIFFPVLLCLLFSSGFSAAGQEPSNHTVNSLRERNNLSEGWKYSYGDESSNSSPEFDDSAWNTIQLPISGFPLNPTGQHYVWFRYHFTASQALTGQPFGVFMNKLPDAAEIFCNGSLIGSSGRMPENGYYGIDTIPRSFIIPQGVLNYGGDNVLSIRIYSEREKGDLKGIFITNDADRLSTYQFEFFFNPQLGMIITLISIFAALYFLIMFIRQTTDRFNLYLCIGSVFFAVYYTSLFIESAPVPFLVMMKIQLASLHIGVAFFAFYFQDFFRFNMKPGIKIIIGAVIGSAVAVLMFADSLASVLFINNSILYLFMTVPLLLYMMIISLIQLIRKKDYALLLVVGVTFVIGTGVHDMLYAVLGLQPRFWLNGWGMIAFLLSIFLTSANRFMDIKISAERESQSLIGKTHQQMLLLENIRDISLRMKTSGETLNRSIEDAGSASERVVSINTSIEEQIRSQAGDIERNNESIRNIISSIDEIVHFVADQAALVEQSSSSVTELAASVSRINETTVKAKEMTERLSDEAGKGRVSVESAAVAINEINESSGAVKEIVNVIGDIASTINLLGMNASIEAAHAGQYGRGFAVVANEIRKLAEDTASSSKLIMAKINDMAGKIGNGLDQFGHVRGELGEILDGIGKTEEFITHITQAAGEQDNGAKELLVSVQSMLEATQNVRNRTARQKEDTERIRKAILDIQNIFSDVLLSTDNLSKGGEMIVTVMENLKKISIEHRSIQDELDSILVSYH